MTCHPVTNTLDEKKNEKIFIWAFNFNSKKKTEASPVFTINYNDGGSDDTRNVFMYYNINKIEIKLLCVLFK